MERKRVCNLCGVMKGNIMAGVNGYICFDCVEIANKKLEEHKSKENASDEGVYEEIQEEVQEEIVSDIMQVPTPSKIKAHLDEYIIGQEEFKKKISVVVYNHYKRFKSTNKNIEIDKSNVLLVGSTGSGKTYSLKVLAKLLDVPFTVADANTLTQNGYVGNDPETMLKQLYDASGQDLEKTQRGIIYIDEIDKIGRKGENVSITRDVGGEGIQQALLKIVEGCTTTFPMDSNRKNPLGNNREIDTSNILFIIGGSFEGIDKIVQKRLGRKTGIGFGAKSEGKNNLSFNECIKNINNDDLRKFGMLPEFLGRFPVLATLEELDIDALKRILSEPKNALIKQFKELFAIDNIKLEFADEALDEIARKAIESKAGARGLRKIMEDILYEVMYIAPDMDIDSLTITKEIVQDPKILKEQIK